MTTGTTGGVDGTIEKSGTDQAGTQRVPEDPEPEGSVKCVGNSHYWSEPGPCQCGAKWLQVNGKIRVNHDTAGVRR